MKKIKVYIWILGVLSVIGMLCIQPQYAETAARAFMLLLGEGQCGCG